MSFYTRLKYKFLLYNLVNSVKNINSIGETLRQYKTIRCLHFYYRVHSNMKPMNTAIRTVRTVADRWLPIDEFPEDPYLPTAAETRTSGRINRRIQIYEYTSRRTNRHTPSSIDLFHKFISQFVCLFGV